MENLILLAAIGGAAGVGVGFVALRGLLSLLPRDYLPVAGVPLDGRVLAFTLAVSVADQRAFRHAARAGRAQGRSAFLDGQPRRCGGRAHRGCARP